MSIKYGSPPFVYIHTPSYARSIPQKFHYLHYKCIITIPADIMCCGLLVNLSLCHEFIYTHIILTSQLCLTKSSLHKLCVVWVKRQKFFFMKIWRTEKSPSCWQSCYQFYTKINIFYLLKLVYKLMCVICFDIQHIRNFLTLYTCNEKWICHIFLRNCLLIHVTEGKTEEMIEVTDRRGKRRKHLQKDLKEY